MRLAPFYDPNQTKKKTEICLTSLEMFSTLDWTKKRFKAFFETFILKGREANFPKI